MRSGKNSQPARGSLRNLVTNGGSWTVAPVCVTTLCVDTVDIAIPSFENNDQVSRLLILMVDWVTQEGRSDEWLPSPNGAAPALAADNRPARGTAETVLCSAAANHWQGGLLTVDRFLPGFHHGRPALFLRVDGVLAALLELVGLLLNFVRLLLDAGRQVLAGRAGVRHGLLDGVGRLIAQLPAFVPDLGARALARLWRHQQHGPGAGQSANRNAGQKAQGRLHIQLGMLVLIVVVFHSVVSYFVDNLTNKVVSASRRSGAATSDWWWCGW